MSSNRVAKIFVSGNNSFSGVQHTRQVSDLLPDRRRVQIARQQIANILGFGLLQRFCRAPQSFSLFLGQTNRQRGSSHPQGVYIVYDTLQDTVIRVPGVAEGPMFFFLFWRLKKEVRAVKLQFVTA